MMNKPAKLAIENVILSDPVSIPQGAYQFKQNNGIFANLKEGNKDAFIDKLMG